MQTAPDIEIREIANRLSSAHLELRTLLGVIGLSLPLTLLLGGWMLGIEARASISHYYYTPLRDVFVGSMVALALFLVTYRAPLQPAGRRAEDEIIARIAGIGALMVAFFPTVASEACGVRGGNWINAVHTVGSVLFLGGAGLLCLVFARAGDVFDIRLPRRRLIRRIHLLCGITILGTEGLLIAEWILREKFGVLVCAVWPNVIFGLETVSVTAFALSWLMRARVLSRLCLCPDSLRWRPGRLV